MSILLAFSVMFSKVLIGDCMLSTGFFSASPPIPVATTETLILLVISSSVVAPKIRLTSASDCCLI